MPRTDRRGYTLFELICVLALILILGAAAVPAMKGLYGNTYQRAAADLLATRLAARRGLSLIEVLLALAIMLMSLVAIGRLVDFGADRGLDARLNTQGARLAQAKMAEVEAGVIPLEGTAGGQFDDHPEWSWS